MTIIEKIIADLNIVLAQFDADNAARAREWAKGRVAAIAKYRAENQPNRRTMGEWKFYDGLFAVAGGKTWFNLFDGRNETMIDELMDKNSAAIVAKRNALIARKLAGLNISEIVSSSFAHKSGGIDCTIGINTDTGPRWIEIDTIVAGGYNIQCLHNRTLVKVR